MKKLKQAIICLWFDGNDPSTDLPPEIFGVMQPSLEETQRFVCELLATHWNGECSCQQESRNEGAEDGVK